jgi:hypothetical protein
MGPILNLKASPALYIGSLSIKGRSHSILDLTSISYIAMPLDFRKFQISQVSMLSVIEVV